MGTVSASDKGSVPRSVTLALWSKRTPAARVTTPAVRAECCLCMEKFVDTDELRVLPCNHFFHKARR